MEIFWMFLLVGVASGSDCTFNVDQAEENQNVTLEWNFTPAASLGSLTVRCEQTPAAGGAAVVLFSLQGGVEDGALDRRFDGRVRSDADALAEGRLRLLVSELRPQDSGWVRCWVAVGNGGRDVGRCYLNVTAAPTEDAAARPGTINASTGLLLTAIAAAAAAAAVAVGYLVYMSAYER